MISVSGLCLCLRDIVLRFNCHVDCKTRKITILKKWQNRNFDYKIIISIKNP